MVERPPRSGNSESQTLSGSSSTKHTISYPPCAVVSNPLLIRLIVAARYRRVLPAGANGHRRTHGECGKLGKLCLHGVLHALNERLALRGKRANVRLVVRGERANVRLVVLV